MNEMLGPRVHFCPHRVHDAYYLCDSPQSCTMPDRIACPVCITAVLQRQPARDLYALLWDSTNGKHAPWASNPWVWAISFRRVVPNETHEGASPGASGVKGRAL